MRDAESHRDPQRLKPREPWELFAYDFQTPARQGNTSDPVRNASKRPKGLIRGNPPRNPPPTGAACSHLGIAAQGGRRTGREELDMQEIEMKSRVRGRVLLPGEVGYDAERNG